VNISRFAVRDRKVSISAINGVVVSVMFVVYSSPGMASRGYEKKVLPPREGRGEDAGATTLQAYPLGRLDQPSA
jgi:hypothetical protein